MMRSLTFISLLSHVVYGFSSISHHSVLYGSNYPMITTTATTTTTTIIQSQSCMSRRYSNGPSSTVLLFGKRSSSSSFNDVIFSVSRGGAAVNNNNNNPPRTKSTELQSSTFNTGTKCPMTGVATIAASIWGTGGVLYILAKAIKRVLPIALEPFQGGTPLTQLQLGAYIITVLWFAYVEGYKGFQTKFSPLVVKRSFTLVPGKNGTSWYHFLLAPFYSMGLIHATKKRQIVSWSVTIGVAAIVGAVKRLPYPWRNIIDAGVVAGLSWGSISIAILYIKSWIVGSPPRGTNPELPEVKTV